MTQSGTAVEGPISAKPEAELSEHELCIEMLAMQFVCIDEATAVNRTDCFPRPPTGIDISF